MSDTYETDILVWSEQQAALLRRRAEIGRVVPAAELANEAEPDWLHIAEEIEGVGQSQVDAVESWLFQGFLHDLKAEGWPQLRDAPSWRGEARGFRAQARRRYRPSMRQKIDLAGIYADALTALPESLDGAPPLPVPMVCPVESVDELLGGGSRIE